MLRKSIVLALGSGAVLLVVAVVGGLLWGVLQMAGDAQGAAGAKGVTLVALVLWLFDFVTLVVLLAIAELARGFRDRPDSEN